MPTQKVYFENSSGNRLAANIELPEKDIRAYALFVHCFTCGKNIKSAYHISRALAQKGIALFRFDFTGLGESEGEFAETNFGSNIEDILSAARFMETEYCAPAMLIGHSLGGAAAIAATPNLDSVKALVTIGSPADPTHVIHLLQDQKEKILQEGRANVSIAGQEFPISKSFIETLDDQNMNTLIHNLNRALLVMHSPQDEIVGIENAEAIYRAAMHPKSFISLDKANHLLTNNTDAQYVGEVIAAWAGRYV